MAAGGRLAKERPEYVHPAPEIPMRLAAEDEVRGTARGVQRLAQAHGWVVVVTYCRGTIPIKRGTVMSAGRVVDSLALRCRHADGSRLAVVWLDGAFGMAVGLTQGVGMHSMNLTQARAVLQSKQRTAITDEGIADLTRQRESGEMPKVLDPASVAGTMQSVNEKRSIHVIDFANYADGQTYEFVSGEDFQGKASAFVQRVKRAAEKSNLTGQYRISGENVIVVLTKNENGTAPAAPAEGNPFAPTT